MMIDELIALLGEEAFIKLALVFGGSKQYIGTTPAAEARLTVVMGSEAANKMINAYSGGWIDIPKHTAAELELRNKRIIQDYDSGITLRQLAQKYELSERRICSVLKKTL
ncbi:MAG: Mor transcription activator family protein [Halothiobacillaceae bacterium]|nr:Mor transcription activator family protein [Halothiobacillaceae bacterium]